MSLPHKAGFQSPARTSATSPSDFTPRELNVSSRLYSHFGPLQTTFTMLLCVRGVKYRTCAFGESSALHLSSLPWRKGSAGPAVPHARPYFVDVELEQLKSSVEDYGRGEFWEHVSKRTFQ